MHSTRTLITALVALATATTCLRADEVFFDTVSTEKASRVSGAYFGVFGGGAMTSDTSSSGPLDGADLDNGSGWFGGAEVGYYFRTPFPVRPAIELEAFYLGTEVESGGSTDFRSDLWAAGAFVNLILALDLSAYAEDLGPFLTSLRPYVGAGIGAAYTKLDGGTARFRDGSNAKIDSDSTISFAYQLFAGLEVALADDVSVYGEYKYLVLDDTGSDNLSEVASDLWTVGVKVSY
jgi:opacity protein-like surface antigen